MNPLIDTLTLPRFTEVTPELVGPALDTLIGNHLAVIDELVSKIPERFEDTWLPLERIETALNTMWSTISHLSMVADTPAFRDAYVGGQKRLAEHWARIGQRRDLFDLLAGLAQQPSFSDLDGADQAEVHRAVREFRLAGIALDTRARARFTENAVERSSLSTAFANAVLDATVAWAEHIEDESQLAGVSDNDKSMFAQAAQEKGLSGWLVTLQPPHVMAILTFAQDRSLRACVYEALHTRASDRGPQAAKFDNGPRISRILKLRSEAATELGYSDPVRWLLAKRMADDPEQIVRFLRDLASRAKPAAIQELAELKAFAKSELGLEELQPWDVGFASEMLQRARYKIDEQEFRLYFPLACVLEVIDALLRALYGVSLSERRDVDVYNSDVRYFDLVDEDGAVLAGLYADLYARVGKRGGAWMADARPRLNDGHRVSHPVAYLVCNFAPPTEATPSLLTHSEIQTLLHEFGHCLHHLLTRIDRPGIGGINGFEWDAIEFPSQLMEDFAWDRDVLTAMSAHVATDKQLPSDLFDRLSATRQFQSGMTLLRQIEFSLFDIWLHLGTFGHDPVAVLEAARHEVAVLHPPEWSRFSHSFTHIFAGGYAAGYYSYLWAEVLAADAFEKFAQAGLLDRNIGEAFRTEVLAQGAARPAMESFRAFRGREPDPEALLRRRGLA